MIVICGNVNNIPYLSDAELQRRAEKFLARWHPDNTIPVPIEEIVECCLKREIVPVPGLRTRWNIEGFLSMDLKTIMVDEELMICYANRYRSTLAHELGHGVLHRDFIRARRSDSIEDWQRAMMEIPPAVYSRIEAQAYRFAGFFLVPSMPLDDAVERLNKQAISNGIDIAAMGETAADYMANNLADDFAVSAQVIARRLKQDGFTQECYSE